MIDDLSYHKGDLPTMMTDTTTMSDAPPRRISEDSRRTTSGSPDLPSSEKLLPQEHGQVLGGGSPNNPARASSVMLTSNESVSMLSAPGAQAQGSLLDAGGSRNVLRASRSLGFREAFRNQPS